MDRLPHNSTCFRLAASAALAVALVGCGKDAPTAPDAPSRSTLIPAGTSGFVEARTSQIVTDGSGPSQVFDDFTFDDDVTITSLQWQGIYCVQQPNAGAPAPTASSFTVGIYPDAAGRPNLAAPVQTSTYPVAQTGQTFDKNVAGLTCGTAANTTWPFYNYSVVLSTPFAAVAGTKYWISIQATTPSYAVYYGWRDGRNDNSSSLQLFDGVYTPYNVDRAFALEP